MEHARQVLAKGTYSIDTTKGLGEWGRPVIVKHLKDAFGNSKPRGIALDMGNGIPRGDKVGRLMRRRTMATRKIALETGEMVTARIKPNLRSLSFSSSCQDLYECYGHGHCGGYEQQFKCACFNGWEGNCNATTCPSGPAW